MLKRVASTKTEIIIDEGTEKLELDLSATIGQTEAQIKNSLIGNKTFETEFWVHRNRDDTIAIATGVEPDIWPEDMKDEK